MDIQPSAVRVAQTHPDRYGSGVCRAHIGKVMTDDDRGVRL